jgi:hypothetical protein
MRCERKWGTVVFGKHVVHTCMCVYAGMHTKIWQVIRW